MNRLLRIIPSKFFDFRKIKKIISSFQFYINEFIF